MVSLNLNLFFPFPIAVEYSNISSRLFMLELLLTLGFLKMAFCKSNYFTMYNTVKNLIKLLLQELNANKNSKIPSMTGYQPTSFPAKPSIKLDTLVILSSKNVIFKKL